MSASAPARAGGRANPTTTLPEPPQSITLWRVHFTHSPNPSFTASTASSSAPIHPATDFHADRFASRHARSSSRSSATSRPAPSSASPSRVSARVAPSSPASSAIARSVVQVGAALGALRQELRQHARRVPCAAHADHPTICRFSSSEMNVAALTIRHSRSRSSASAGTRSRSIVSVACRKPLAQPRHQCRQDRLRQRQHRQPPQRPIRFLVIGVGRVPRQPEQHRRHPERQRDLARRRRLGAHEIHVRRRQRQGLPLQAALEQHRPPGVSRRPRTPPPSLA